MLEEDQSACQSNTRADQVSQTVLPEFMLAPCHTLNSGSAKDYKNCI